MSSKAILPPAFADLEPFAGWSLATEAERVDKRIHASPAEIRAFYDAMAPRMPAVLAWLDALPLSALPADAERLLWLTWSMAEAAMATEKFDARGTVPLALDVRRFRPLHETDGLFADKRH